MIKTILIEDERVIAEEFRKILQQSPFDTELLGTFSSVKDSVDYLSANSEPDLIFSDVQLPDGLSFDIFNKVNVRTPVIFITGHNEYILNAFEHNAIDYLLKPIDTNDLKKAMEKYMALEKHFTSYHSFVNTFRQKAKTRLIVKRGIENIALRTEDIVLIYTEDKLVFALDKDGKKYILDRKLLELEQELDKEVFFRANRQYIVNISYIRSYKAYEKVKLEVNLLPANLNHHIVISQETAPFFRRWINDL